MGKNIKATNMGRGSIKEQGTIYTSPYMEKARRRGGPFCGVRGRPKFLAFLLSFVRRRPNFLAFLRSFVVSASKIWFLLVIGSPGFFYVCDLLYFVFPFGILKIGIYILQIDIIFYIHYLQVKLCLSFYIYIYISFTFKIYKSLYNKNGKN